MASAARYYVVYAPDSNDSRPWKVMVSEPYTVSQGGHTLRRFKRKANAVAHGKTVARNQDARLAVNRRDGSTQKHFDYS